MALHKLKGSSSEISTHLQYLKLISMGFIHGNLDLADWDWDRRVEMIVIEQ